MDNYSVSKTFKTTCTLLVKKIGGPPMKNRGQAIAPSPALHKIHALRAFHFYPWPDHTTNKLYKLFSQSR